MRKNIVAGNWKMHKTNTETVALLQEIIAKKGTPNCEVMVAPTFVNLKTAVDTVKGHNITVAAQNMHQAEGGAFTGEIAANMLTDIGVKTVILGHSERRAYFHENRWFVSKQSRYCFKTRNESSFLLWRRTKRPPKKQSF